ncbi:hypothetical protein C1646_666104 [Rhizophagus diaphanus]|nr:hypothetical protein C1646_666104 [Rhizophagus diaphanus] [Rhizophagus sp. MUCL 43196]
MRNLRKPYKVEEKGNKNADSLVMIYRHLQILVNAIEMLINVSYYFFLSISGSTTLLPKCMISGFSNMVLEFRNELVVRRLTFFGVEQYMEYIEILYANLKLPDARNRGRKKKVLLEDFIVFGLNSEWLQDR